MDQKQYECPVCGYHCFDEVPDICPVCGTAGRVFEEISADTRECKK